MEIRLSVQRLHVWNVAISTNAQLQIVTTLWFPRTSDTAIAHTSFCNSTAVKANLSAGSAAYLYTNTSLLDVTTVSHPSLGEGAIAPQKKTVEIGGR